MEYTSTPEIRAISKRYNVMSGHRAHSPMGYRTVHTYTASRLHVLWLVMARWFSKDCVWCQVADSKNGGTTIMFNRM